MKPYIIFALILLSISAGSCTHKDKFEAEEHSIEDASLRFPNLPLLTGKLEKQYDLVIKAEFGKPAATIELFAGKGALWKQKVLILSNTSGTMYAIPVPSTRFNNYWNYMYDTSPKPAAEKSGTFETEINKALDTLQLNKGRDGVAMISAIFRRSCNYDIS